MRELVADVCSLDAWQAALADWLAHNPANTLSALGDMRIFDAPLVACADGDAPLFTRYKDIIGPFHLAPRELLPDVGPDEPLRVLCWVLPIAEPIRSSNRRQTEIPSLAWAHTRYYGERCNDALRQAVVDGLEAAGYMAVAPVLSPAYAVYSTGTRPPAASWSERHALYAAGLGTFGLSDGLITPRGMAMRCGSVVTNAPLPVTPRVSGSHTAYCPYLADGSCGACIVRCPAGAIGPQGHDKARCADYIECVVGAQREQRYAVTITGCGLCQTGVPCEARIPPQARERVT